MCLTSKLLPFYLLPLTNPLSAITLATNAAASFQNQIKTPLKRTKQSTVSIWEYSSSYQTRPCETISPPEIAVQSAVERK